MATLMGSLGRASAEHRFLTGMALVVLATVLVGFGRTFFLRPLFPDWPSPPELIFYVHGLVFTAWIVLLLAQVSLVAGGRIVSQPLRLMVSSTEGWLVFPRWAVGLLG